MVDVRDQVLTMRFSPLSFICWMRFIKRSWTHGPFFVDLPITHSRAFSFSSLLTAPASAHYELARWLVLLPRPVPDRRHTPRGHRVPARRGLAFAASVRVVDGIHRGAARLRPDATMPVATGFAYRDVLVVDVADRADRRTAVGRHQPPL